MNCCQNVTAQKICQKCVLPDTFPNIRFDLEGTCQYCRSHSSNSDLEEAKTKYGSRFEELITTMKLSTHSYDALVAFSGGKDSTYTLDVLKNHYGLRLLALTFDHGFISPYALNNINQVVEKLGIDHIYFKPDFQLLCNIFRFSLEHEFHPPKALERASSICNTCMGLVKFIILRTAVEKNIPFIVYGWSPGQAPIQSAILKNQPAFVQKAQDLFLRPLEREMGPRVRTYFLEASHFEQGLKTGFPYNINLFTFFPYDEKKIYECIQSLGWTPPKDTDPNSTNCLLNGFANSVHIRKHHFHPYAMEMAELVRRGVLGRQEALRRLSEKVDPRSIEEVVARLGLVAAIG